MQKDPIREEKKCWEVMKQDIECCGLADAVPGIAERMRARNIGFMPVCDSSGVTIGALTDRDLALRVLAGRLPPDTTTAAEVMTRQVVACSPDDTLMDAEMLMSKHKVSRVVCVDAAGHAVGVISLSDVAEREAGGRASAILRSVSQRETSSSVKGS
jgi:CBS domain-containing protein